MPGALYVAIPGNEALVERLAAATGGQIARSCIRRFPDGEWYVRLDTPAELRHVVLVATMHPSDEALLPLLLGAATARELGASRVGIVAPYLGYLRQDRRFHAGEGVTSRHVARLLSAHADWIATVDPHLHRYASLAEIYPVPTHVAKAAPALGRWIAASVCDPLIIGPDAESAQWARAIADAARAPVEVLTKVRRGDREVSVSLPPAEALRGRTPVLIDDIISTGATMAEVVRTIRRSAAAPPVCAAVHAVFARGAHQKLRAAGAARVVSCNTIPHPTNAVDVVPALVAAMSSALADVPPA